MQGVGALFAIGECMDKVFVQYLGSQLNVANTYVWELQLALIKRNNG